MLRTTLLLGVSLTVLLEAPMPAAAQLVEAHKLTASDAAEGDWFGHSVGVSGNTAIVGAYRDDDDGNVSGSAYLFDVTTGEEYPFKLTASDASAGDRFGYSVAVSGNIAIVGAYYDSIPGVSLSGSAYLFDVSTGAQLHKLTASDAARYDYLGKWVAISGNTAIVAAAGESAVGTDGAAYLFDVTTGNQLHKLIPSDAADNGLFGASVAISGNTAIVGASRHADPAIGTHGAAYLFDVTTGEEYPFKLTTSDATMEDYFGNSVAISGNTAVVAAFENDDAGIDSGSAFLFDVTTGNQLHKLTASDAAAEDFFGKDVAISGNTIIVGAYWDDDTAIESGSAYIFVPEPSGFILLTMGAVGLLAYGRRRWK